MRARAAMATLVEMVVVVKVVVRVVVVMVSAGRAASEVREVVGEEEEDGGRTRREKGEAVTAGLGRPRRNLGSCGGWRWWRVVAAGGGRTELQQWLGGCRGWWEMVWSQCWSWCRKPLKDPQRRPQRDKVQHGGWLERWEVMVDGGGPQWAREQLERCGG